MKANMLPIKLPGLSIKSPPNRIKIPPSETKVPKTALLDNASPKKTQPSTAT